MRFIHTADWHLGRSFYNTSLIHDQAYVLNQIVDLARETKPDVFIIAGDIYDRAIPPGEAVELLDEVLSRLVLDIEIPAVVLIAGNHDNPVRIQFGSRLMQKLNLHVVGTPSAKVRVFQMYDDAGIVCFYPLPYAEPSVMRSYYQNDQITDHEKALKAWVDRVQANHPTQARSVLIAHGYVTGGVASESERPLSVGATGTIDSRRFDGFDYVALGHLHCPQTLGDGQVHYSGSLLKYSFSEIEHRKAVNVVEMDGAGKCTITPFFLKARHDVRVIEGNMQDLLRGSPVEGAPDDYIKVRLLDRGAMLDVMSRLRAIYPNVMEVDRAGLMGEITSNVAIADYRHRDMRSLFSDFYQHVTGEPMNEDHAGVFAAIIERMQQEEREA